MPPASQRFLALDIFRGMTICFMIIVNTSGNGATTYPPLEHAAWNGFTPTDLVFPSFMFAVGNAMSFVMLKWTNLSQGRILGLIFKRTLIIFLLGYLMYWFPFVHWNAHHELEANPIGQTRIMGVLQRIALGYFFGSLMMNYLKPRSVFTVSIGLLVLYWIILLLGGAGGDPYNIFSNIGTRIDQWLLGSDHMYFHREGIAFEPEGILGTIPSVANVTLGCLAGQWIQKKGREYEGLTKLLLAGVLAVIIALCWDWFFPINKKLWTGSFVLLTVGIDCILIAGLIYITDFKQKRKWGYFFEVFGRNPLFIYLLSELVVTLLNFFSTGPKRQPLYSWIYQHIFRNAGLYFGAFLFAVCYMLFCWVVGYILDKRKIYVRV